MEKIPAFYMGKEKWSKKPVYLIPDKSVNPHIMIVGYSGAGKTYLIREMVSYFAQKGKTFYVFDVQGDMNFDEKISQKISISETSNYGINPMRISDDKEYGGVRKRIRNFIGVLNRTSRKLGNKQEYVLINLLKDLYYLNGFYEDNPESWKLSYDARKNKKYEKRYPTLKDLLKYVNYKMKEMIVGGSYKNYKILDEIAKAYKKLKQATITKKEYEEIVEKYKKEYIEASKKFIAEIENGSELDKIIKYDSLEVLKSLYGRLENLYSSGIFKEKEIEFDEKNVRVIDLKTLNHDEQKIFIETYLENLFLEIKAKGIKDKGVDTFFVIDEAKKFIDDDNIINIIVNEGRKYGIGLIFASQSITHFSQDILQSTANKIILGIDNVFVSQSARMLGINEKKIYYLVPQKTFLFQSKGVYNKIGDGSGGFIECEK